MKEIQRGKTQHFETDVLIVGGGMAGGMAALAALRSGLKVMLVDKADTRRSGGGGTGNDHFGGVIVPGQSEWEAEDLVRDHTELSFGFTNQDLIYVLATQGIERVKYLESLGIQFLKDPDGKYHLIPQLHKVRSALYYTGRNLKPILTKEMLRQGVKIFNRTVVTSLLTHEKQVIGATGLDTRTGEFRVFHAKTVVLTTGTAFRLFPNNTGYLMNTYYPPSSTGDGLAIAYRAGAALTNMEGTNAIRGPKGLQRAGSGTYWPARTVDAYNRPLEYNFPGESYYRWPGKTATWTRQQIQSGKISLPLFRDTASCTEEEIRHIEWGLSQEGGCWLLLEYMKQTGKDFRYDILEDDIYERRLSGGNGLKVDGQCKSSLEGLYSAGEILAGTPWGAGAAAITLGWYAGEQAAQAAGNITQFTASSKQVEAEEERVFSPLGRTEGVSWKEANLALQMFMSSYMGDIRSAEGIKIGQLRLAELQQEAVFQADNSHEMLRVLEVENLVTLAETMMAAALTRECSSSYHMHYRTDFPQLDLPEWRKWVVVERDGNRPATRTEDIVYRFGYDL